MNILFTICGRAGSKGIKNKNLKDFLQYPLPFYTVSAIDLYKKQNPDFYCDVALNTDSSALIKMFKQRLNFKVDIIERKLSLALDNTPKVIVIYNCLDEMKRRKSINYDIVVDLDITSPLRTVEDVSNLIRKKIESNVDIVFSVTDSRRNPYFNMVVKTEKGYERVIASSFNARQEAPDIFDMNASLYAYSPEFLESGKGIFEGKCDVIKMLDTAVLDLDHENDFHLMQVIAEYLFQEYPAFKEIRDNINKLYK
ncbi:TPA: acylneuraminate cytidylyltransferase family protein [Clostridium botulinum]|uniref:acylneuraminate cytidylyltransferase family protein n=1 Tax=Clostridium TaxID=1485 RepID=UPI00077417FF|nr:MULTISPECIES: CMP-N-acetylneuraminic acid synthetase [Clostridium]AUM96500.1 CMP-N-acetylneuraminic acid synthetase [Clostridium sporogenes]AVQ53951.1 CMP-N-acetylneuraminic acid synthetase [Clostridium botulinum]HBJ2613829.1 acylneuraminate cytidylyltransferase family protein [Clostridium botulinum]